MKNGMNLKASAAPEYQAVAGRPRREVIAQCDRCHAESSAELATTGFATVLKVLGFRVYDAGAKNVMQAEANWRDLDLRATESRDVRLISQADAARVHLYRLRDAAHGDSRYWHQDCDGVVQLFDRTASAIR
jgi:hypothetical protein